MSMHASICISILEVTTSLPTDRLCWPSIKSPLNMIISGFTFDNINFQCCQSFFCVILGMNFRRLSPLGSSASKSGGHNPHRLPTCISERTRISFILSIPQNGFLRPCSELFQFFLEFTVSCRICAGLIEIGESAGMHRDYFFHSFRGPVVWYFINYLYQILAFVSVSGLFL